jgi:glutamyl-tRNA synthetase
MVNFLALLGWSPGDDREVLSRSELIDAFRLEGISGGNAVFNPEKLDWFNQQHLARLSAAGILDRISAGLAAAGMMPSSPAERVRLERAVDLVKPRARKLADVIPQLAAFVANTIAIDPAAAAKHLADPALESHLEAWRARLAQVEPFDAATIEAELRAVASERGIKAAALIHATRVAVTGQAVSPGLFDVLEIVGRERVLQRLATVPLPSRGPA